MLHGVTDDTLARAAACLGDPERAGVLRGRALATYERIGAQWWRNRLVGWAPPVVVTSRQIHFHPVPGGAVAGWPSTCLARATGGFAYLRELLLRPRLQELAALDLVGAVSGAVVDEPGLGEVLDDRAVRAYDNAYAISTRSSRRRRTGPTPAGWKRFNESATPSSTSSPVPRASAGARGRRVRATNAPGWLCARPSPRPSTGWTRWTGRPRATFEARSARDVPARNA